MSHGLMLYAEFTDCWRRDAPRVIVDSKEAVCRGGLYPARDAKI
jgi:hypothetical protein